MDHMHRAAGLFRHRRKDQRMDHREKRRWNRNILLLVLVPVLIAAILFGMTGRGPKPEKAERPSESGGDTTAAEAMQDRAEAEQKQSDTGNNAAAPMQMISFTAEAGAHMIRVSDQTLDEFVALKRKEYNRNYGKSYVGKLYRFLGMSVGIIVHDLDSEQRQAAYPGKGFRQLDKRAESQHIRLPQKVIAVFNRVTVSGKRQESGYFGVCFNVTCHSSYTYKFT